MTRIGIIFGTDTGRTRVVAKTIAKKLTARGLNPADPVNVNRITPERLDDFDLLILGTPTLGDGELPGLDTGLAAESWAEFLPRTSGRSLAGRTVALFGLGDQVKYSGEFVDALADLHQCFSGLGARLVGHWPTSGYEFAASRAVGEDGHFLGLALDQINQPVLTDGRLDSWLEQVLAESAVSP